jgi:hypothetical protein
MSLTKPLARAGRLTRRHTVDSTDTNRASGGAYLAVFILTGGVLASVFNVIYLGAMLLAYESWTDGAYHQPVLTTLFVWGGGTCAVLVLLVVVGLLAKRRALWRREVAGGTALAVVGALAGGSLLFIHVNELTVAHDGFRQPRYAVTTEVSLRLYNAATVPVTLCLGRGSTCGTADGVDPAGAGTAPSHLRAPGLTLGAGETVKVRFPRAGEHALTIVDPVAGMARVDTVVAVSSPPVDNSPPQYR